MLACYHTNIIQPVHIPNIIVTVRYREEYVSVSGYRVVVCAVLDAVDTVLGIRYLTTSDPDVMTSTSSRCWVVTGVGGESTGILIEIKR